MLRFLKKNSGSIFFIYFSWVYEKRESGPSNKQFRFLFLIIFSCIGNAPTFTVDYQGDQVELFIIVCIADYYLKMFIL